MPFLRFSRDKRGVESFSLVHTTTNRRGKVRPRVLYFFRTPPDIKVGREPFDSELRRALEKQYPDITFDWRAIADTPIPSADADKWRERRRADRAAKHAAAAEASAEAASDDDPEDAAAAAAAAADPDVAAPDVGESASVLIVREVDQAGASAAPLTMTAPPAQRSSSDANRKRRRRRRGGRPSTGVGAGGGNAPSSGTAAPSMPPSGVEPSGD